MNAPPTQRQEQTSGIPWVTLAFVGTVAVVTTVVITNRRNKPRASTKAPVQADANIEEPEAQDNTLYWVLGAVAFVVLLWFLGVFERRAIEKGLNEMEEQAPGEGMAMLRASEQELEGQAETNLARFADERAGVLTLLGDEYAKLYGALDGFIFRGWKGFRTSRMRVFTTISVVGALGVLGWLSWASYEKNRRPTPFPPAPTPVPVTNVNSGLKICDQKMPGNDDVCLGPLTTCTLSLALGSNWRTGNNNTQEADLDWNIDIPTKYPEIIRIEGTGYPYTGSRGGTEITLPVDVPDSTIYNIWNDLIINTYLADLFYENPLFGIIQRELTVTKLFAFNGNHIPSRGEKVVFSATKGDLDNQDKDASAFIPPNSRFQLLMPQSNWRPTDEEDQIPCSCFCFLPRDQRPSFCQQFFC